MQIPNDCHYTAEHVWVRRTSDNHLVVGITDFAQDALGNVEMVDLPPLGTEIAQGTACGTLESLKAVSEFFAPVSGNVVAHNEAIRANPLLVNDAPYDEGWLIVVAPRDTNGAIDDMLDANAYRQLVDG